MLHLSEPSSATAISRLQDRQEAQLAADAAASKFKRAPFWSEASDVVSHSTYKPLPGVAVAASNSAKSEMVDRLLATLEQVQPAAPPSRDIIASLKGAIPYLPFRPPLTAHNTPNPHPHYNQVAVSFSTPVPGKYYELLDACTALDTQALGALSRSDFERALSSSALGLHVHEVGWLQNSTRMLFFFLLPHSQPLFFQVKSWMQMIKNDNIDYDQVALRFASPVPPRVKNSVTIAALKHKFALLPAAARSLDEHFDGFLSEGSMTKALTKAGVVIQLADIRFVFLCNSARLSAV
jgi:hypothetical protein